MSGIKDQEQLEEMRNRLYSRGTASDTSQRHELTDRKIDVARNWGPPPKQQPERPTVTEQMRSPQTPSPFTPPPQVPQQASEHVVSALPTLEVPGDVPEEILPPPRSRKYRKYILLGSVGLLLVGVALAAALVLLGSKRISADNIAFNIAGQNTIGSSDTMSLQVAITNQNAVAIEDTTLIVRYPDGTRTVTDPIKNVYEDRIAVGTMMPGEARNIPVQVAIYGKENDIKEIKATLEYRVTGSNGTFTKEAEPLKFQIISSPVTLKISSVGKVAAGQPMEVTLVVKSNTNKVLKDVLVSAAYPNGFVFKDATPKPIYNQNVWKIDELKPEESVKIVMRGSINGLTEEKFGINFSAGLANTDNQYIVGSPLAEARTEFQIEKPFIAVDISIDGDADRSVVLEQNKPSSVSITLKNTLNEAVYDTVVEVVPSGNVLNSESVDSRKGFYDSNKNIIRWDVTNSPDFSQINPGSSRQVDFTIKPTKNLNTATFDVTVNVYAKRVSETSAQEQLIGTVTATAKYSSSGQITGQATAMTGPLPPKVGETSKYLITLAAEAGSNNMTNAVIKTSLPTYVEWQNDFSGPGGVDYNPVSKQLTWTIGDVSAGMRKELSFSVSILPSTSQIDITPILVNGQTLTATDRFTGTNITSESNFITAELSKEAGYTAGNGKVTN